MNALQPPSSQPASTGALGAQSVGIPVRFCPAQPSRVILTGRAVRARSTQATTSRAHWARCVTWSFCVDLWVTTLTWTRSCARGR